MSATYETIDRKALREAALVFNCGSSAQNRYGSMMDRWLNEGTRRMYEGSGLDGIYDEWLIDFPSDTYTQPIGAGIVKPRGVWINDDTGSKLTLSPFNVVTSHNGMTTRPSLYCFVGRPDMFLVVGPGACDADYQMIIKAFRTPRAMLHDTSVPELPVQFINAPSYYAASMAATADHDHQHAAVMMGLFKEQQVEFQHQQQHDTADQFHVVGDDGG